MVIDRQPSVITPALASGSFLATMLAAGGSSSHQPHQALAHTSSRQWVGLVLRPRPPSCASAPLPKLGRGLARLVTLPVAHPGPEAALPGLHGGFWIGKLRFKAVVQGLQLFQLALLVPRRARCASGLDGVPPACSRTLPNVPAEPLALGALPPPPRHLGRGRTATPCTARSARRVCGGASAVGARMPACGMPRMPA